jgi:FtsZ-binding cell division protein ZapB
MIPDLNDLSDKIARLAALAASLRSENAQLRQSNALLASENEAFMQRLGQAQERVQSLLARLPAPDAEGAA